MLAAVSSADQGGLSRLQFWVSFAALLGIFLFWSGPIWRHAQDVDGAAWASYLPIPLVVLGCLAWSRRLSFKWFALDTIALTGLKFAVTYAIATVLWATVDAPAKAPYRPRSYAAPTAPSPAPAPSPLGETVTISGLVVDSDGVPVAGVLAYVATGLEDYTFAAPDDPVVLRHDGSRVQPPVAVVQTYQPLQLRSERRLHTFVAEVDGQRLFNRAAPVGVPATLRLTEPAGIATVRSRVDPDAAPSILLVVSHPFAAITGADGRFSFSGVPDVPVELAAYDPQGRSVSIEHRQESR